nr:hypothetical protein [Pseudescherichia vulneris]
MPQGDGSVQGEVLSPTQPFPTKPAPLLDQSKKPESLENWQMPWVRVSALACGIS